MIRKPISTSNPKKNISNEKRYELALKRAQKHSSDYYVSENKKESEAA